MSSATRKIYKVLAPVERKDGKTHWLRVGSAFPNRDESINLYLDAMPLDKKLQIRELDEDDLRRDSSAPRRRGEPRAGLDVGVGVGADQDDLPF